MGKFYVVLEGRQPGIYTTWEDCKDQVEGYPNAKYKAFYDQEEAARVFRTSGDAADLLLRSIATHIHSAKPDYMENPQVELDSIAVDAACSGNPGKMEYRGVYLRTGQEIFKIGPYEQGTNNIGEFLAIVHALALLAKKGSNLTIYSDSKVAQKWVRDKHCNTKLVRTPQNSNLIDVIKRAENWLRNNTYTNHIIKWNTEEWGEIPADFGRK